MLRCIGTLTSNPSYFVHPRIPYHCIQITISEAFRRLRNHAQSRIVDFQSPPISRSITFIYDPRGGGNVHFARVLGIGRAIHNYETNQT